MSPDDIVKATVGQKVEITDLTGARKSITIEVPADRVALEHERVCRKYARGLRVPGFREGKVPLHIIRQRFGREVEQETVEHVIEHALKEAIEEERLKPLRAPVLKGYKHQPGEPLRFTAEFEVRPRVSVQGASDIRVTVPGVAVTDAMVRDALDTMRERAARFVPVDGRGVRPGDHVVMNIEGVFAAGEGESFARENILAEIGSGGPNPELTDPMRDMTPGETREFTVSYPADHPSQGLAGRRVSYKVTVREIKLKQLPDLDDEFARDLKLESLSELRRRVESDLQERERRKAVEQARQTALDQLIRSNPDTPVPDVLVEEELDRRIDEIARTMILQGMDPRRAQIDWDEIRGKQHESAVRSVRAMILLDAIAEEQEFTVEPAALDRAIADEAARRRQTTEAFRAKLTKDGRLKALEEQLLREKVLDFLLAPSNT